MTKQRAESVLKSPRLPSLPAVAMQVLELTGKPSTDIKQIAQVIQNDQALAARIIRTVNSSYFGLSRPCADINQAMIYLGLNAVKMLALGFSLVHGVRDDDEWQVRFDYITYWRRSMHAAAAAREIARLTQSWDPEEAFLAALLQDLGMIALYRAYDDIYLQAIDLTDGDHALLPSIEQRSFQTDHAAIGAALAARWNMPVQLVEATRFHHDAEAAPEQWVSLARTVQLAGDAAAITAWRGTEKDVAAPIANFKQHGRTWFGLEDVQLQGLLDTMVVCAAELSGLFKVDLGGPAEVDDILCRAEDEQLKQHLELERKRNCPPKQTAA